MKLTTCSILAKDHGKGSCMSTRDLREIAQVFRLDSKKQNRKMLIDSIKNKLGAEQEWSKSKTMPAFFKIKLGLMLKPKGPESGDINNGLDTIQMNTAMKQHTKHIGNKNNVFLGVKPCDYYSKKDIPSFDVDKKYGLIFNTDEAELPGTHWVSLVIDMPKNSLYYFDSYGRQPNKCLYQFIERVLQRHSCTFNYNHEKFQVKDGLCGLYAMEFVLKKFRNRRISFEKETKVRNVLKKFFVV